MSVMRPHVSEHHCHVEGAPTRRTPGCQLCNDRPGGVDDCRLMSLLSLRALSALVMLVLLERLPYMEYSILPENPWKPPMCDYRTSLGGRAMVGTDCQLETLGKFSVDDSMLSAKCSYLRDEQLTHPNPYTGELGSIIFTSHPPTR